MRSPSRATKTSKCSIVPLLERAAKELIELQISVSKLCLSRMHIMNGRP